ncbi:DUF4232 domain-containing protein [Streptacidiphilus melanogenes]|uniref:DUF4232 domain-containing protein n=1 Tax=Streptacidiphilus melanogenes TaxID=411235 RepID=UPI000A067B46|nr:DUF4232 domain-containing protein [Streptacidiphilus melanogenes]
MAAPPAGRPRHRGLHLVPGQRTSRPRCRDRPGRAVRRRHCRFARSEAGRHAGHLHRWQHEGHGQDRAGAAPAADGHQHRQAYAYGYPYPRFGDAQAGPADIPGSVPQAVVALAPGQSAYALVHTTSGGARHSHTVHFLEVYFPGAAQRGSVGPAAPVALPRAGVRVDESVRTTYWQATARLALRW